MENYANDTYVSAASAWEIATKFRIGKLPQAAPFIYISEESLRKMRFKELAVTVGYGQRAGLLAGEHKDPFDRILIAQAQAENLCWLAMRSCSMGLGFSGFGDAYAPGEPIEASRSARPGLSRTPAPDGCSETGSPCLS